MYTHMHAHLCMPTPAHMHAHAAHNQPTQYANTRAHTFTHNFTGSFINMDAILPQASLSPVSFIVLNLKLIAMVGGAITAAGAIVILGLSILDGCFNKCVLVTLFCRYDMGLLFRVR